MGEAGRGGREMGGKWEGDVKNVEGHSSEYMFIIHGLTFTMLFLLGLCGMEYCVSKLCSYKSIRMCL